MGLVILAYSGVINGGRIWNADKLIDLKIHARYKPRDIALISALDTVNKYNAYIYKGSTLGWVKWVDASGSSGGDVNGPASSTNNAIAVYNGTTGKVIKNSLALVNTDGSLNIPLFTSSRSSSNKDLWMEKIGSNSLYLKYNIAGTVYSVELSSE